MAREQDVLSIDFRKDVIKELLGEENQRRKAESFKKLEVYRYNTDQYIRAMLKEEYSKESAEDMRKLTSVNPAEKVTDEMSSVYLRPPERIFSGAPDEQVDLLREHYRLGGANVTFKKANRFLSLLEQCALQVIPRKSKGVISGRVLAPHQYDVIPREDDPEEAMCYIINTFDKSAVSGGGDGTDQIISDQDDDKKKSQMRFVWWTDNYNFTTDGHGAYVDVSADGDLLNPIGELPFIDLFHDKDSSFWVRKNSTIVDFALEFGVLLSDVATSNRNQGFSQAIFSSQEKPERLVLGRQQVMWIKQSPDPEDKDPKFEWATPSPDIQASVEFLEVFVKFWLSTKNVDTAAFSGKPESKSFASGVERLLAMLEKFEASADDIDLFRQVEDKYLELVIKWHNALSNTGFLKAGLDKGPLTEGIYLDVKFAEPQAIQTKTEKEDSVIKLKEKGIYDDIQVIMELEEVDEEAAINIWLDRKMREAKMKKALEERLRKEGLAPNNPFANQGREAEPDARGDTSDNNQDGDEPDNKEDENVDQ